MVAAIVIAVVALIAIVVMKSVRVTEGPVPKTVQDVKSAEVRERIAGAARLRQSADQDVEKRPRAEKLWNRAADHLGRLSASAAEKGIQVAEVDLGSQLSGATETLYVQVDYSGTDPEFLVWTEQKSDDASSGLSRIRQIRAMVDHVSAWIASQPS
jgi:hypothetical protein